MENKEKTNAKKIGILKTTREKQDYVREAFRGWGSKEYGGVTIPLDIFKMWLQSTTKEFAGAVFQGQIEKIEEN